MPRQFSQPQDSFPGLSLVMGQAFPLGEWEVWCGVVESYKGVVWRWATLWATLSGGCLEPWRWRGWTDPSLFSRAFNDWELDFVECFLQKIQTITAYRDMEDRVIWSASRRENILVKSLYFILEPGYSLLFPSSNIWRSCAPPKVAFFSWEAYWGKVLFVDRIQRRGVLFSK